MKPKTPWRRPEPMRYVGTVPLGKREATLDVVVTLTVPPDLTPREMKMFQRFNLATALTTMRAVPSGRADAILASIKAKLDTVSVSDYLRPADEIADEARAARGARARVAADTKRRAAKKAGKKRTT